jgi:hypothetical protein
MAETPSRDPFGSGTESESKAESQDRERRRKREENMQVEFVDRRSWTRRRMIPWGMTPTSRSLRSGCDASRLRQLKT